MIAFALLGICQAFPLRMQATNSLFLLLASSNQSPVEETTLVMIKPDGVQRGLIGEIIKRFESRGLRLRALKLAAPNLHKLQEHYFEHRDQSFYSGLIEFMTSGPVVIMVWQAENAVAVVRSMVGATHPIKSPPGTIRGDYALNVRNICHASDSSSSAEREIKIWFPEGLTIT